MPSNHIDLLFFSCMFLFSKPLHWEILTGIWKGNNHLVSGYRSSEVGLFPFLLFQTSFFHVFSK